jgi:hypothetical protein
MFFQPHLGLFQQVPEQDPGILQTRFFQFAAPAKDIHIFNDYLGPLPQGLCGKGTRIIHKTFDTYRGTDIFRPVHLLPYPRRHVYHIHLLENIINAVKPGGTKYNPNGIPRHYKSNGIGQILQGTIGQYINLIKYKDPPGSRWSPLKKPLGMEHQVDEMRAAYGLPRLAPRKLPEQGRPVYIPFIHGLPKAIQSDTAQNHAACLRNNRLMVRRGLNRKMF